MVKKYSRHASLLLAFLVSFLIVPSLASAATYYVSTTGSDSNPGTSASPWRTIQKPANTMAAGDTATVNAGTYNERVSVTRSGSSGNFITFRANGTVVTKGFTINANYNRVDGFEITTKTGSAASGIGVSVTGHHNTVQNNYIHDLWWEGITVPAQNTGTPSVNNNKIIGNRIFRARMAGIHVAGYNNIIESNDVSHTIQNPSGAPARSGADADGMRFFGVGNIFRKNYIHDMLLNEPGNIDPHMDCFQTWNDAADMVFEQNTCINDNDSDGASGGQGWMVNGDPGDITGLIIRNNVIKAFRIANLWQAPGSTVVNNTFIGNQSYNGPSGYAIELHDSPHSRIQNNVFYNHSYDFPYLFVDGPSATGLIAGTNSVYLSNGATPKGSARSGDLWQIDPELVNPGSLALHLLSTSPLINAGITISSVTNDKDGTTRPQGSAYDIGAYEVVSAPAFNYSLSNSGAITATQRSSGSTTITATLSSGTTKSASYAASGLPTGATATFSATSCNPTCSTTLTINTTASTPIGSYTITVTGSPLSKTTSFILTVPPPPPPSSTYLEAESGALASPMTTGSDTLASGGSYIWSATAHTGTANYTFTVPAGSAGTYYVWGRILSPNTGSDSFYVKMDSGTEDVYDTVCASAVSTSWQWTKVNARNGTVTPCTADPRTFFISAGSHTLTFRGRERNTKLDRIFITKQASDVP